MPQNAAHKEYNTFIKGLVTEANPLTFPENASIDEANFVLNRDGSRQRRLGIDYEASYALSDNILETDIEDNAITTYTWKNIQGLSNANIVVVQVAEMLYLYDADNDSISGNKLVDEIDLSSYQLTGQSAALEEVDMAEVRGRLVVTSPVIEPIVIFYNKDDDAFGSEILQLYIRDFIGLNDGLPIEDNPTALSDEHNYNLQNQGWLADKISAYQVSQSEYPSNSQIWIAGKDSSDNFDPALLVKQHFGTTPAPKGHFILDLFRRRYNTATGGTSAVNINESSCSYSTSTKKVTIVTSSAHGLATGDTSYIKGLLVKLPILDLGVKTLGEIKGFYVVTVVSSTSFTISYPIEPWDGIMFFSGTATASTYSSSGTEIISEDEDWRISTVTSYGGRAFYSGLQDSRYSNHVFFSKILEETGDLGTCHQVADPTAEEFSDLVASDGGYIVIAEASKIIKMITIANSVIVFATNGIWQISGAVDGVFSALEYEVSKLSDVGTINKDSIVIVESSVIYWAEGGIYILSPDNISGKLNAQNISEQTIQTLYLSIPSISRVYATGTYDQATKRVSWLYNDSDSYDGVSYRYKYTKELVFDVTLGAFYKNEFGELASLSPYVAGYIKTSDVISSDVLYDIYVGSDAVLVNADQVQITLNQLGRGSLGIKYLTVVPQAGGTHSKITFSEYTNLDFLDWETADATGISFSSYLVTGHEILGDTTRTKQGKYITFHFERTETGFEEVSGALNAVQPSSCLVQARWGWSNHTNSGRWGTQFQAYRLNRNYIPSGAADPFNYGFEVITTKNKLRGHGKAFSMRIDSEAGKDMHLLGWGIDFVGRSLT